MYVLTLENEVCETIYFIAFSFQHLVGKVNYFLIRLFESCTCEDSNNQIVFTFYVEFLNAFVFAIYCRIMTLAFLNRITPSHVLLISPSLYHEYEEIVSMIILQIRLGFIAYVAYSQKGHYNTNQL